MRRIIPTMFIVCFMAMSVTCGATGCSAQQEKLERTYENVCVEDVEITRLDS